LGLFRKRLVGWKFERLRVVASDMCGENDVNCG
jgi:hypothetical protein